jgi:hypothetical protein
MINASINIPKPLEIQVDSVPVKLRFSLTDPDSTNVKGISKAIFDAVPPDRTLMGLGGFPQIGVEFKPTGFRDPTGDIQDAISRIYNHAMQAILKPIWDILGKIMDVLKRVFSFVLDLKIPLLDLTIPDLFKANLYQILKEKLTKLWDTARDKLIDLLKLLGIPWPIRENTLDPEKMLAQIIDSVTRSLWNFVFKTIAKIVSLIKTALTLWDRIVNKGTTIFGILWQTAIDTVLGKILSYILFPPTMEDIKDWIIAFAKKVLKKVSVTYEEIMSVIKNFKIPILNIKPFDWDLPLNPHFKFPEFDFQKMLLEIKTWFNNYVISIIKKFIDAILKIIQKIFFIDLKLPDVVVPIVLPLLKVTTNTATISIGTA